MYRRSGQAPGVHVDKAEGPQDLPALTSDLSPPQAQTKSRHKVMGVLDIYGFEIFEVRRDFPKRVVFIIVFYPLPFTLISE